MITEDYVSYEVAKLLKEKGFDGDTNCYYIEGSIDKNLYYSPIRENHNKRITNNEFDVDIDITSSKISAPTLQMAMKWLRDEKNIHIKVHCSGNRNYLVYAQSLVTAFYDFCIESATCSFNSYEEACETAIKYCLENLI